MVNLKKCPILDLEASCQIFREGSKKIETLSIQINRFIQFPFIIDICTFVHDIPRIMGRKDQNQFVLSSL